MMTLTVISVLVAWIFLAVWCIVKRKKNGKCIGCGGDCSKCQWIKTKTKGRKEDDRR